MARTDSASPPDGNVNWEDAIDDTALGTGTGYQSPLMARMSRTRLSVTLLQESIPAIRDGEAASERLARATSRMGDRTRGQLQAKVRAGEAAKEQLFAASLPLIRAVATREWHRRQQWGSQVALEDLLQEAILGFLKGISSFKVEAIGRSATNYLGQWMLVETRRAAEVLDHDLQVGHDAGERFRRVRALRTRLAAELEREPTDEEISDASRNPDYVTRPGLVGKAPKDGEERSVGKGLTVAQVAEERSLRTRVGRVARFSAADDADDTSVGPGLVDPSRISDAAPSPGAVIPDSPEDQVMSAAGSEAIAALLGAAMDRLGMPNEQREIVSRRYGLPPYAESSAREISREMGVQRDRVSKVLAEFQFEMVRTGGSLHAIVKDMNADDLRDVGLGWVVDSLGDWPSAAVEPPAEILLQSFTETSTRRTVVIPADPSRSEGFLAWFVCDFHDRTFSGMYAERRDIPKARPCPSCQRPSERVKVVAT